MLEIVAIWLILSFFTYFVFLAIHRAMIRSEGYNYEKVQISIRDRVLLLGISLLTPVLWVMLLWNFRK